MTHRSLWLCAIMIGSSIVGVAPMQSKGKPVIHQPYKLHAVIQPDKPRAGGPVELKIVLTNQSDTTARVGQRSLVFDWRYDLTWQDGSSVAMTRFGEEGHRSAESGTASAVLRTLAPGEQLTAEIPLHRVFDLSTSGTYRLVVSRALPAPSDGGWIEVRAEPVEFLLRD